MLDVEAGGGVGSMMGEERIASYDSRGIREETGSRR